MTGAQVKSGESRVRAGTRTLSLLSTPTNVYVLEALTEGPMPLAELRRAVGSPPQTTLRGHLRKLGQTGVVERRRQPEFPGSLDFELTSVGRELWEVVTVLRAWLALSPEGALELGSGAAKSAIKALVEGWSTSVVRALAARPLSLTELNDLINGLSYPSLERRLGAMRMAGLIAPMSGPGRGTPYAVTKWLRSAVAPLGAATRWERVHAPDQTAPIRRLDAEAGFLLAVPLLTLPRSSSGVCRLGVEIGGTNGEGPAGVLVEVREGRVASCLARARGSADAWAVAAPSAWLGAVIEGHVDRLELGGNVDLARTVVEGLHQALFAAVRRR